jgi:hypothetical protein
MNPNNYASLEMSRKLVEAGIVLETDFCRDLGTNPVKVVPWPEGVEHNHPDFLPAPSMAELWAELPESTSEYGTKERCYLSCQKGVDRTYTSYCYTDGDLVVEHYDINPCDALAKLLIWVKERDNEEI